MGGRAMRAPALRGRWLAAAGRHVFSPESFERLVEPALADLQLEDTGRLGIVLAATVVALLTPNSRETTAAVVEEEPALELAA